MIVWDLRVARRPTPTTSCYSHRRSSTGYRCTTSPRVRTTVPRIRWRCCGVRIRSEASHHRTARDRATRTVIVHRGKRLAVGRPRFSSLLRHHRDRLTDRNLPTSTASAAATPEASAIPSRPQHRRQSTRDARRPLLPRTTSWRYHFRCQRRV